MNIVYSFIGKLPYYIILTIFQLRLYCKNPIYLIYDDYKSIYIEKLKKIKNIIFIKYEDVNKKYLDILNKKKNVFKTVNCLGDRKLLFYRSFERFYLLRNLMDIINENEFLFLELDNLLYSDPNIWVKKITKNIAFLIDNINRASTGVFYVKNKNTLDLLLNFMDNDIPSVCNGFYSEMGCVYKFYNKYKKDCFILPSYINDKYEKSLCENFNLFDSLFDPSTYGIFLLGHDKVHGTRKYTINKWGIIKDINRKNIVWKIDKGLKKPYYVSNNKNILINNLHIHSKNLLGGLSKILDIN